jgi:hypothetical protein
MSQNEVNPTKTIPTNALYASITAGTLNPGND